MVHINPLFLFLFNSITPLLLPRNRRTVTTLLSLSSVNHPNQHRSLAAKLHHPSPLSLLPSLLFPPENSSRRYSISKPPASSLPFAIIVNWTTCYYYISRQEVILNSTTYYYYISWDYCEFRSWLNIYFYENVELSGSNQLKQGAKQCRYGVCRNAW